MSHCRYDNPLKFQRELWLNGYLIQSSSAVELIRHNEALRHLAPEWIYPWCDGQVVGDASAMLLHETDLMWQARLELARRYLESSRVIGPKVMLQPDWYAESG